MKHNANGTGHRWLKANAAHIGDDCLLWPFSCCTPGYGQLMIDYKFTMAHRVMCRMAHGNPPSAQHLAAHSCGNRKCCNPKHLSWKTGSENQRDRPSQGRPFTGRRRHFNPDQVRAIREMKGIRTSNSLASEYGCTESNIRQIQTRFTYKHVL